jgi:hypothetical protein
MQKIIMQKNMFSFLYTIIFKKINFVLVNQNIDA